MKVLIITITGRANILLDRVWRRNKVEDVEYFLSGLCDSVYGKYDEEWDAYLEDNMDMLNITSDMHIYYRPIVDQFIERTVNDHGSHETVAFDISINPVPSEGVNLLTVKPYILFDAEFGEISYTELNLI